MAVIEIEGLAKSYRVYQKPKGSGGFHPRTVPPALSPGRGGPRHRPAASKRASSSPSSGPNGAGKTTTLKLLSGVITPSGGTARVLGHVPWKRENAYRRRFALVMGQKNQLWWDLPAAESFRLHQQIYRIEPQQFEQTRDELTEMLGVGNLLWPAGPRVVAGGADEDGADRRPVALARSALSRRADDRPGRGCPVQHPDLPAALPGGPQGHHPADQPLHEGRGGAVPPGGDHRRRGGSSTTARWAGIIDRFGGHKVITLQFSDGQMPAGPGPVRQGAFAPSRRGCKLRVDRGVVPEVLAQNPGPATRSRT